MRRLASGPFTVACRQKFRIWLTAYAHLQIDPRHPSLHLKKAGDYWSVRVGLHYRALAVESENDLLWVWIGTHAEYDEIVG